MHADIGDLGLLKSHDREMGQALKVSYAGIANFRIAQAQFLQAPQLLQPCQPGVRNPGVLQV